MMLIEVKVTVKKAWLVVTLTALGVTVTVGVTVAEGCQYLSVRRCKYSLQSSALTVVMVDALAVAVLVSVRVLVLVIIGVEVTRLVMVGV